MAAYVPGTDTEEVFVTSIDPVVSTFATVYFSGVGFAFKLRTKTTTVEFRGLSRAEAKAMANSADYNYDNKSSVSYYGGAAWFRYQDAIGTSCRAVARRINEADMWRVVVNYVETTALPPSGWTTTPPS